ncbi:uncharacterized protein [Pleurodeles waltl]|uniref:uncharacterized protein isoform X1 n=1 Tax=Pleurodeles waltl TaxID=8319 RepID=UPI003709A425
MAPGLLLLNTHLSRALPRMDVPWLLLLTSCLPMVMSNLEPGRLEEGRTQLQRLQEFSRHPRFGDCWTGALKRVDMGCRQLDEDEQSHIALAFTHCHLQRSGRAFPACTEKSSIRECTQGMDAVAFGAYTEFFTHAHSICYFLQNEVWQKQAEDTILRLTVNSDSVARQLEATNHMAAEMIQAQNATLQTQEEILRNGDLLKKTLQDSTQGVKQAFEDMQHSASEQRLLFAEIFNRVTYLHQFVVGESNTLYSFLYNLLACTAVFLVTSTQRTAGARLMLFAVVAMNVYAERLICSSILESAEESGYEQMEKIAFWVGIARKTSAAIGFSILGYFAATYRDVHRQNLQVLQSLRSTQAELQHIVQEAERLLGKRKSPRRCSYLSKFNETFVDSGMLDPSAADLGDGAAQEPVLPPSQAELLHLTFGPSEEPLPASQSLVQRQVLLHLVALPEIKLQTPDRRLTSTPRKRAVSPSRKASRRSSAQRAEPAVYNIPVSEETSPRYNLRSGKSPHL